MSKIYITLFTQFVDIQTSYHYYKTKSTDSLHHIYLFHHRCMVTSILEYQRLIMLCCNRIWLNVCLNPENIIQMLVICVSLTKTSCTLNLNICQLEYTYCVSVHSLCYEQTVMFVNTLRLYIGLEFSLRLEKNFDARPVGRVLLIHGSYRQDLFSYSNPE